MKRHIETFWTEGRAHRPACITLVLYENGNITATADEDKITQRALLRALSDHYGDYVFSVGAVCGRGADAYYIIDGTKKLVETANQQG